MNTDFLKQVWLNNQEGCSLLVTGNVLGALQMFKTALKILQMRATTTKNCRQSNEPARLSFTQNIVVPHLQVESFFAFTRAACLPPFQDGRNDDSLLDLYSCTVLFNLALSYQCSTFKGQGVEVARNLYTLCATVAHQESDPAIIMLSVLATNNRAHIRYLEGNYDEAFALARSLTIEIESGNLADEFEYTDLREMLLNPIMLYRPPIAAAAA